MVKLSGPLFSIDAQGPLGDMLIYKKVWNQPYVAKTPQFKKRVSIAQQMVRVQYDLTVGVWQGLPTSIKQDWNDYAKIHYPNLSGYDVFCKLYIEEFNQHKIPSGLPPT